jgi:hypothetical protein
LALKFRGEQAGDIGGRLGVGVGANGFGDGRKEANHDHHRDGKNAHGGDDFEETEATNENGAAASAGPTIGDQDAHRQNPAASFT